MHVAILFVLVAAVYTVVQVLLVALRNYKKHQFYKRRAPDLPVLPNPNIFSGHMFDTAFNGKNWRILDELHKKLGPTFGYYMAGDPWISTKDLDLIKLIELDQPNKHINRAKFHIPFKVFENSIFQKDDDDWRRVRRAIAPALTNLKVRSDEISADIVKIVEQLEDGIEFRMKEENGERSMILDTGDMFKRYTLSVIFSTAYRRDGKISFRSETDRWTVLMELAARDIRSPFLSIAILFPFIRPLFEFLVNYHATGVISSRIENYIIAATDVNRIAREKQEKARQAKTEEANSSGETEAAGGYKRRLVDTIIDALMEKRLQYDEFIGTLHFLVLAGFMTTADTISRLVWQLAWLPEIQEKLRKSIETDGIESEYLGWCIQETLRIHPAVPLGVGRVLGDDVTVNGLTLPKGAFVMCSNRSVHHDPNIWPEPEEFKPERWRDTKNMHPAAFLGFGLGPRNCVGGKMAVHEIKLVMQLLMKNYRIETCPETPATYEFSSPGMVYTNLDEPAKVKLVTLKNKV